jgi:hypothetical protein
MAGPRAGRLDQHHAVTDDRFGAGRDDDRIPALGLVKTMK